MGAERNHERLLDGLLCQWQRWQRELVRRRDTRLEAFNEIMDQVPPKLRTALVVMAMNLSVGVSVWSSRRLNQATAAEARVYLLEMLRKDEARWFGVQVATFNEKGYRIGESRADAVLKDRDVELMLELAEEVNADGTRRYSNAWLADKFECNRVTVWRIVNGERRSQPVARVKKLGVV